MEQSLSGACRRRKTCADPARLAVVRVRVRVRVRVTLTLPLTLTLTLTLVLTEQRLLLASTPTYKTDTHVPLTAVQEVRD